MQVLRFNLEAAIGANLSIRGLPDVLLRFSGEAACYRVEWTHGRTNSYGAFGAGGRYGAAAGRRAGRGRCGIFGGRPVRHAGPGGEFPLGRNSRCGGLRPRPRREGARRLQHPHASRRHRRVAGVLPRHAPLLSALTCPKAPSFASAPSAVPPATARSSAISSSSRREKSELLGFAYGKRRAVENQINVIILIINEIRFSRRIDPTGFRQQTLTTRKYRPRTGEKLLGLKRVKNFPGP